MKSKTKISFKYFTLLMLLLCVFPLIMSCSDDNDEEPTLVHHLQVDGDVNGEKVSINENDSDVYYEIGASKSSNFRFYIDTDKITQYFTWTVKLKETPDTTITLYLRLYNIARVEGTPINSPNLDRDTILNPKNICYVIVRNVKTDSVERYFNVKYMMYARWNYFMVRRAQRLVKKYGYTREYLNMSGDYAGIEGQLLGTLYSQRDRNKELKINLNFTVF